VSAIIEAAYPSRIEGIRSLRALPADSGALREAAASVRQWAEAYGRVPGSADWRAFADGAEIAALLTDWANAVSTAQADADRHLRAARERLRQLGEVEEPTEFTTALMKRLAPLAADIEPGGVGAIRAGLANLAMPVAIVADPELAPRAGFEVDPTPRPADLAVAFLEFTINGAPAANLHSLRPKQVHDLGLTIRVSRWPDDADSLAITPVSFEPASVWELPNFSFPRPEGEPPHTFQREGRMVIHAPQGFDARPLEFVYAAEFRPPAKRDAIVVAGQRRLRLDGIDLGGQAITGYPSLDRRILDVRTELRQKPMVAENDIRAMLLTLAPLANLAGAAIQDALYPVPVVEAEFEKDVRERLRSTPSIGAELEQQAHAAGGRTDLSFRGIRIELKSERKKRLLPEDCAAYADQAASYAVGTGKRLAILCVLDCSAKTTPPIPVDRCVFLQSRDSGGGEVHVVTVLVQGGLAKPSALSR
jgi:hypothetical protein